jgi:(1->4)-alpha-D-glucan 1-alpha-D-glucosylmutase
MDREELPLPRIPVSTYRLQFNHQFTFSDATKIIPYLDELGITDVYASPYFKASKGSSVGYSVIDPGSLNPELGTEESYKQFTSELQKRKMGQILDLVPNHMYIDSEENVWWTDVLENGPSSPYANFFDIDWSPVKRELENRILMPILGEQYGMILERKELELTFEQGAFFLYYYEHRLPILPETYTDILTHSVEKAETQVSADDPSIVELRSIMTALRCLPSYTVKERDKITERNREKEIIKRRLYKLYKESLSMRQFIEETIRVFNGIENEPHSFDLLDGLLSKQVWRLSYWRVATDEINYRRFFDINNLAAIRIEDPVVFQKTHQFALRLIREKRVTGLRIDHPDGLYDPAEYLRRLQRESFLQVRLSRAKEERSKPSDAADITDPEARILKEYAEIVASDPHFKPFYIVGEKILSHGEKLPEDWPIFSSIGYVFLNPVNGIFVDKGNMNAFDKTYGRFIGTRIDYQDLVYEKKRLIILASMSGEINMLANYLNRLSEMNRHTRDFTLNSLRNAITDAIACFPVYRTYITYSGVNERDRRYVEQAISKAKRRNTALSESIFDYLKRVLLLDYPEHFADSVKMEWVNFTMKFQQVTGPVMAKGVEDTVFYVYNRLLSLNEVGGDPESFGTPLEAFHAQNVETARTRPYSLLATSTHDTKRSEDVRARLNVLSEIPDEWRRCLARWGRMNRKKKPPSIEGQTVPDRNEEYLLYQTLLGVWPTNSVTGADYETLKKRIRDYMLKATREAKVNSSWINPDVPYEEALLTFVDMLLLRSHENLFLKDFLPFQEKISYFGMFNSLSQTLLKITSPGVPDFYQGTELWDLSLVDPDNRRPVDFRLRAHMIRELKKSLATKETGLRTLARRLFRKWRDGAIKLYVTFMALNYRKENHLLFKDGRYLPFEVDGAARENVCAYARIAGESTALIVVPRFLTRLLKNPDEAPFGEAIWGDTGVLLPDEISGTNYRNIFTRDTVKVAEQNGTRKLPVSEVLTNFPVALLEKTD